MESQRQWAHPASTDDASVVMTDAARQGLSVLPHGAGLGWGTAAAARAADVVVDTRVMNRVLEHAAGDLVARVQAGATMGHVAEVLSRAGQRLALDVPPEVSVGGMIATGLAGPLRFRYGSPRDLLLGITVVRPDGVVARSGGKVVKNVAGYDLGKLFAGSHGTLGLITEATFRLHPLPKAVAYLTAGPAPDTGAAASAIVAAANSALLPAAVELGPGLTVGVLLEGTPAGVASRARAMAALLNAAGPAAIAGEPPPWWGLGPWQWDPAADPAPGVARVTFWLRQLGEVLALISAHGGRLAYGGPAGAGLLYLCGDRDDDLMERLRRLVAGRGSVRVLSAPMTLGHPLAVAVRDQFDPERRMKGAG